MKVAIIPNEKKVESLQAATVLQDYLDAQGVDSYIEGSVGDGDEWSTSDEALYAMLDSSGMQHEVTHARAENVRECSLVIALGGDGTTLHAARLVGFSGVPILGFNFGNLGFLSGGIADEMMEIVQTALSGEIVPSRRTALSVEMEASDGSSRSYFSFNEIMVSHGSLGTILDFEVNVNGVHLFDMRGDGLIVCTASGSTAHALSAGGPIVAPGNKGPIIVPVAPHTLQVRPVVCDGSDVVEVCPHVTPDDFCSLFIDGKIVRCDDLVSIQIRRGPADVCLLQPHKDMFYRSCAKTFFER